MKRRALSLVLVLAGTLGAFAFPGTVSAAGYGCNSSFGHLFSGRAPGTSANEAAVVASIQAPASMHACDTQLPNTGNAVSAWVALVPGSGNPSYGDSNSILQVGVQQQRVCQSAFPPICTEAYTYFRASGGCNGAVPDTVQLDIVINNHNFGTPVNTLHKYRIDVSATGYFLLTMDDITIFDSRTDGGWSRVSCWILGTRDIQILGEKSDHSDRYAVPPDVVNFSGMKRKYQNTWFDLNGTTCEATNASTPHPDGCTANGTVMDVWTASS